MEDFFDFSMLSLKDGDCNSRINSRPITRMNDNADCINNLPLAMAYVPMQRFDKTYEPDAGLGAGTIFPDLNKPFYGCSKRWDDVR